MKHEKAVKTNAMRLLDQAQIPYRTAEYAYDENDLSGMHAAEQTGMPPEQVFKTLVARATETGRCWYSASRSAASWISKRRRRRRQRKRWSWSMCGSLWS